MHWKLLCGSKGQVIGHVAALTAEKLRTSKKQFSWETKFCGAVSPMILDGILRYGAHFKGNRGISKLGTLRFAESLSS